MVHQSYKLVCHVGMKAHNVSVQVGTLAEPAPTHHATKAFLTHVNVTDVSAHVDASQLFSTEAASSHRTSDNALQQAKQGTVTGRHGRQTHTVLTGKAHTETAGLNQGPVSIQRLPVPGMGIPMLKIRWSRDRLIFNMGIPILVRRHLYIESASSSPTGMTHSSQILTANN